MITPLPRIPGIGWVIAFILLLVGIGGWGIYRSGVQAGARHAHQAALTDSVLSAVTTVAIAAARSNRSVASARRAHAGSGAQYARRAITRAAIVAMLDSTPPPVVQLLRADDELLVADSVTMATQAAAIDTLLLERAARAALDTLRVNQVELTHDDGGLSRTEQVALVIVAIEVLDQLRRLLHR